VSAIRRYTVVEPPPAPKIQVYIHVPPDNSWDIVAAGFFCLFISQGIIFSHGKIIKELSETLHIKISEAAFIGSVQTACFYFFGPFASAIVNKYGFRIAGCLGAIMSTAGFLLCFGLPKMESILFGYGLLCKEFKQDLLDDSNI
jgi:MFS family permease